MVEPWVADQLEERDHRACLGIRTTEHQTSNASIDQRTGAHRTRLLSHEQRAFNSPLTERLRCFPERDDLGMCRGVAIQLAAITPATDDLVIDQDHRADGYITRRRRGSRLFERESHAFFVGHTRIREGSNL